MPVRDHYVGLRVKRLVPETVDARSIVFDVPDHLAEAFTYAPGQFVTLRLEVEGQPERRSYSMSSAPGVDDELQVTVKRVPGGVVSSWLIDELAEGDVVEVSAPTGRFLLTDAEDPIVAFAGGSGITPVYSLIKSALHATDRRVRLLFANQQRSAAIFGAALDDLASRHPDRLEVVHHLDAGRGFLQADGIEAFLDGVGPADFYLCGPAGFMDLVETTLLLRGTDAHRIHLERFTPLSELEPPGSTGPADGVPAATVTITVKGRTETVAQRAGSTILQSARWADLRAPSSCEVGHCATCMALVLEGRAEMRVNDALTPDEVAEGWILTCQAVPVTDDVRVVYDP
jgi:3-ketosteroid 9alpha-monooxygenase subunit B